ARRRHAAAVPRRDERWVLPDGLGRGATGRAAEGPVRQRGPVRELCRRRGAAASGEVHGRGGVRGGGVVGAATGRGRDAKGAEWLRPRAVRARLRDRAGEGGRDRGRTRGRGHLGPDAGRPPELPAERRGGGRVAGRRGGGRG